MCACRQKITSFFIKDILCTDKKGKEIENRYVSGFETKNVMSRVQELDARMDEPRRNTYPVYPTPIKPNYGWSYKLKNFDSTLSSELLRNQLTLNRFASPAPFNLRPPYNFDRVACCSPWWRVGGRRKGGQVRFSAAQTSALESRFRASKYLSPDDRRALASSLRLSDRQVKTWFQNRRAKWRRTTSECTEPGSPNSANEDISDDDDVLITDP